MVNLIRLSLVSEKIAIGKIALHFGEERVQEINISVTWLRFRLVAQKNLIYYRINH